MTTPSASARRGQPILVLIAILAVWTFARAAMWNPLFETEVGKPLQKPDHLPFIGNAAVARTNLPARPDLMLKAAAVRLAEVPAWIAVPVDPDSVLFQNTNPGVAPFSLVSGAQMISARASAPIKTDSTPPGPAPVKDDPRWTFDRWLLMRAGSGAAAQAPGAASYGASQAGAIARFRLGTGEVREAYGYLRTSIAINAPGDDKELALGFGFRPVKHVPLRVLAEARLFDSNASVTRVRPVVTVISELPWQALPAGFRAEAYGQAGFAGGRDSTAFFDAQAVIDRPVGKVSGQKRDLRIGAGMWAGGQEGAVRLDLGPRLSFPLDLGEEVPSRIALDWRFRIAGNARPPSGPALTIASSF